MDSIWFWIFKPVFELFDVLNEFIKVHEMSYRCFKLKMSWESSFWASNTRALVFDKQPFLNKIKEFIF